VIMFELLEALPENLQTVADDRIVDRTKKAADGFVATFLLAQAEERIVLLVGHVEGFPAFAHP
jgi:hypothetical protein